MAQGVFHKSANKNKRPAKKKYNGVSEKDEITMLFSDVHEDKPIVLVEVYGKKLYALLDTGAENCLIDEEFVKTDQFATKTMAVSIKSPVSQQTLPGLRTVIDFRLAKKRMSQPVCVVKLQQRVNFQMILGFDWCVLYNAVIDCEKRTVKLQISKNGPRDTNNQSRGKNAYCCGITTSKKDGDELSELYVQFRTTELGLDKTDRIKLESILSKHKNILIEDVSKMTGANVPPYEPKFKSETPIYQRQYRIPHSLYEPLRQQLDKLEKANIIKKTHSPYNSPVLVLPKKDSKEVRICLDLRKINKEIVNEQYPLMRIEDILESLGGARIFSSLDLNNGYFNIKLTEEAQKKFAFSVPFAKYSFTRLCQGALTSAAVFQKIMVECLHDIILKGHVFVYLDDIIIHSPNIEEHLATLEEVLTALEKVNLAVKPSKCKLFRESIKYLGHMVDKNGCKPVENSVAAIQKLARPTTVKGVRSFLGSLNFYRKFILNFAEIAAPLYDLLKKKNVKITWNEEAEVAFQTLKQKLTSAPLLIFPKFDQPFTIKTDASLTSLGAVLEQENEEGELQPIAYASRRLNKAERNYAVIERETLAIVFALEQFKHMTYGNKVILQTDHKPLTYLIELKDTCSRVARWLISIQQNDIHFEHIPGKLNSFADMLSRSHEEDESINISASETERRPITIELMREEQLKDQYCSDLINSIKENKLNNEEFILDENQILMKLVQLGKTNLTTYRILVPVSLVPEVLSTYHDSLVGGHFSLDKTIYTIKRNYTWQTIFSDIRQYIKSCEKCQRRNRGRVKAPIQAVEPPSSCMAKLSIDILGPFSTTQKRNKYIITYTDHFSRMTFASPLPNQEAHTIAQDYMKTIYTRYGGSKIILSDRGPQLVGNIMSNLYKQLGITRITTQSYWPRANGVSERINTKILNLISHYCNSNYTDWDVMLPYLMQAINNTVHSSTKQVPFYIFHGFYQFDAFSEFNLQEKLEDLNLERIDLVDSIMEKLERAKSEVFINLQTASINNAKNKDRGRHLREFNIGDAVLVLNIPSYAGHNRKLNPRYTGPYTVIRRSAMANYHVQDISRPDIIKNVHVDKLKIYTPRNYLMDEEVKKVGPDPPVNDPVGVQDNSENNYPTEETNDQETDNVEKSLEMQVIEYADYLKSIQSQDATLAPPTGLANHNSANNASIGESSKNDKTPIETDNPEATHSYFLRKRHHSK